MTVSGLIALLMDCLSAIVVNYCILYALSTFTLLICLMTGAVVHWRNLISASSCFSLSSFTWSSKSSVICPTLIYNFQSFQLLFLSRASFFVNSRFTIYRQEIGLASYIVSDVHGCTPISIQAYGFLWSIAGRIDQQEVDSQIMMFACGTWGTSSLH